MTASNVELILIINGFINTFASIITLILLKYSNQSNSYNKLIKYLTIFQMLYDICNTLDDIWKFIFDYNVFYHFEVFVPFAIIIQTSGLATTIITVELSWLLFYIIVFRSYIDVTHYEKKLFLFIIIPCVLLTIGIVITMFVYGFPSDEEYLWYKVYHYTRLILILLIIILMSITFYTLSELKIISSRNKIHPIFLLSKKLVLYPVIQLFCRVPNFVWQTYFPNSELARLITDFTIPCGGLGNFFAFCLANSYCKKIISDIIHCRKISINSNDLININQPTINFKSNRESFYNERESINKIKNGRNSFINAITNDSVAKYTIDDFDIYDDEGKEINFNSYNYNELDEEQLTRHIAILQKYQTQKYENEFKDIEIPNIK